jgi:hypothetical protein
MRLTSLFPQLFGFGDRASALWAGHPYALARTALRQELAGGGISLLSPAWCLMLDVARCPIAVCLLAPVRITGWR